MCWCRIRMVLIGLLGLLCVVHVVSGMCGQTFTDPQSSALMAQVVLEGKVKQFTEPDLNGLFNATISVRKNVPKGKDLVFRNGKRVKKLSIGRFQAKADPDSCIGALRLGSTYIFFLNKVNRSSGGLYFELSAMPVKRSKKRSRLIKKVLCSGCAQAPKIRKLTGAKSVDVGSKAILKCSAKATPQPVFTWYRNGILVKRRKGLMIKSGKRQSKLKIKKVGKSDVGVYTCVVKNAVGTDSRNFTLIVKDDRELLCETQTYCLNGGTCKYNPALDAQYCECAPSYKGLRCQERETRVVENKTGQATLIYERTLIIVGLVIAVLFLVAIFIASYILAKRRRRRFEAKRRRKEARRAKEKGQAPQYVKADKYTPYTEENHPRQVKTNQYGRPPPHPPAAGSNRLSYENENGFDFHSQQTQPLLFDHQHPQPMTDNVDSSSSNNNNITRPGAPPESRRRLVASSVYDNADEPALIWPSSPQRLTTAEVLTTPEAIEMNQLPPSSESQPKSVEEPTTTTTTALQKSHPSSIQHHHHHHHHQPNANYSPSAETPPVSVTAAVPYASAAAAESQQPPLGTKTPPLLSTFNPSPPPPPPPPPPHASTNNSNDNNNSVADQQGAPPILPVSSSSSSLPNYPPYQHHQHHPQHHDVSYYPYPYTQRSNTVDGDDDDECSDNHADADLPPPITSYPSPHLWSDGDPGFRGGRRRRDSADSSSQSPVSATNHLESPRPGDTSRNRSISDAQDTDQQASPPSYQTALKLTGQRPHAMMLVADTDSEGDDGDDDDGDDDGNRERGVVENGLNGVPGDLHISEEDLDLSRGGNNFVSDSFNSLSNNPSSRQASVDGGDFQHCASSTPTEPWHHPKMQKQQSDDIHNGHLWRNPLLPIETPRSYSLDAPGPLSREEENLQKKYRPNYLSSTLADSQEVHNNIQPDVRNRFNHVDNTFDPSDDSQPWDTDASVKPPGYMNMMSEEEDRLQRLKDVCPDQPAIPI